jgi:hypothetical protein
MLNKKIEDLEGENLDLKSSTQQNNILTGQLSQSEINLKKERESIKKIILLNKILKTGDKRLKEEIENLKKKAKKKEKEISVIKEISNVEKEEKENYKRIINQKDNVIAKVKSENGWYVKEIENMKIMLNEELRKADNIIGRIKNDLNREKQIIIKDQNEFL